MLGLRGRTLHLVEHALDVLLGQFDLHLSQEERVLQGILGIYSLLRVLLKHLDEQVQSFGRQFGVAFLVEGIAAGSVLRQNFIVFLAFEDRVTQQQVVEDDSG